MGHRNDGTQSKSIQAENRPQQKKEAGNIEFFVNCEPVTKTKFFGENAPKALNNGTSIGYKPGQLEFESGAGALESTLIGKGTTAGKIKLEGYEEEELISVKNP